MVLRIALNADTTPLSVSDTLMFKSLEVRAREAFEAGFMAVNVDRSEPGLTVEKAVRILGPYRLEPASGFFHGEFYCPEAEAAILEDALRQAEFSKALGQNCLFVSALVAPAERHAVAGRVQAGEGPVLDDRQFAQMCRVLEQIGRIWRDYGITLCYHQHLATYVEAPREIERLLQDTDPELVKLGPDTGHLFFGGADPVGIIERHFDRVGAIHLKDVRQEVAAKAREERLDYRQACALGVWTELGTGVIDFTALFRLLNARDWSGWIIVETDHTQLPTALESSRVSRRYLRESFGI